MAECDCCVRTASHFCSQHDMHACEACWVKHQAAEHADACTPAWEKLSDLRDIHALDPDAFTTWEGEFITDLVARPRQGDGSMVLSPKQREKIDELWSKHCDG